MSQLVRYDFQLEPEQQLDALLQIPDENRGLIYGVVTDEAGQPVRDAAVKLLRQRSEGCSEGEETLEPIIHEFTDENGQFLFGPLCSNVAYSIEIWATDARARCCKKKVEFKKDYSCLTNCTSCS